MHIFIMCDMSCVLTLCSKNIYANSVGIGITCLSCGKIIKSFNASLINLRCLIEKGLLIKMSTRNLLKIHSVVEILTTVWVSC